MTSTKRNKIITALVLSLAVVACSPTSPDREITPTKGSIEEGAINSVPPIEWAIVSQREMENLYSNSKKPLKNGVLHGFIGIDPVTGATIVVTTRPRYVDDEVACTLGHEVMHAALGNYHPEVQ